VGLFSAAVTALASRGGDIAIAIKKVSKVAGIDPKRLRNFRDNISRGRVKRTTTTIYNNRVAEFAGFPADGFEAKMMHYLERARRMFAP
jgi:hypothetical protein